MPNTLEYADIFQRELDAQMIAGATSGWMEQNAGAVIYNGGSDVKIPVVSMDGLGKYDRDNGYVKGTVSLSYQLKTMTQDRGRAFTLDAMDVNETNFVASAGNVMGQFQRTQVIPEVDAYRYSAIAKAAIAAARTTPGYTPDAADILTTLRGDLYKIWDAVGDGIELVISINTLTSQILESSTEIQKTLGTADFAQGGINLKVRTIDGVPLVRVPSARMYSAFNFLDGVTAGQEAGGFTSSTGALPINWEITARNAPIAVSKTDTLKIFDPLTAQGIHGWKIEYRKYHDLWVTDNKIKGCWVNTQPAA